MLFIDVHPKECIYIVCLMLITLPSITIFQPSWGIIDQTNVVLAIFGRIINESILTLTAVCSGCLRKVPGAEFVSSVHVADTRLHQQSIVVFNQRMNLSLRLLMHHAAYRR